MLHSHTNLKKLFLIFLLSPAISAQETDYRFASVVMLGRYINSEINYSCSGVIVSKKHILTAAHCLCTNNDKGHKSFDVAFAGITPYDSIPGNNIRHLMSLSPDIKFYDESFCKNYSVNKSDETFKKGDLAIITLLNELEDDCSLSLHCIGAVTPSTIETNTDNKKREYYVAGFGKTSESDFGGEKNFAKLTDICSREEAASCINAPELTHNSNDGTDTCNKDSGGGLFVLKDKKFYLVGLTSRAIDNIAQCGRGGIYVNLKYNPILLWLRSELGG